MKRFDFVPVDPFFALMSVLAVAILAVCVWTFAEGWWPFQQVMRQTAVEKDIKALEAKAEDNRQQIVFQQYQIDNMRKSFELKMGQLDRLREDFYGKRDAGVLKSDKPK